MLLVRTTQSSVTTLAPPVMAEVKVTPGTSGVPEITKPVNNEDVMDVLAQNICEDLLTPHGCLSALKGMATNKAPCLDGFPAEFYLQF